MKLQIVFEWKLCFYFETVLRAVPSCKHSNQQIHSVSGQTQKPDTRLSVLPTAVCRTVGAWARDFVAIAIDTPALAAAAVTLVRPVVTFLIAGWHVLAYGVSQNTQERTMTRSSAVFVNACCDSPHVLPSNFFPACFLFILDSSALHGESKWERQKKECGEKIQSHLPFNAL